MDRLFYQSVTCPAGTLQAAPLSSAFPLEDAIMRRLAITIPDGHNGLTGIRILRGGQQIMPWANNQYIVANNRTIPIDYDDEITESGLNVVAFNVDVFDHTFYIEAVIADLPLVSRTAMASDASSAVLPSGTVSSPDPLSPEFLIATLPQSGTLAIPEDQLSHPSLMKRS